MGWHYIHWIIKWCWTSAIDVEFLDLFYASSLVWRRQYLLCFGRLTAVMEVQGSVSDCRLVSSLIIVLFFVSLINAVRFMDMDERTALMGSGHCAIPKQIISDSSNRGHLSLSKAVRHKAVKVNLTARLWFRVLALLIFVFFYFLQELCGNTVDIRAHAFYITLEKYNMWQDASQQQHFHNSCWRSCSRCSTGWNSLAAGQLAQFTDGSLHSPHTQTQAGTRRQLSAWTNPHSYGVSFLQSRQSGGIWANLKARWI